MLIERESPSQKALSHKTNKQSASRSVVPDSLWPHGLYSPWNSPGQNTGVSSLSLLQGIFPTQGSNSGLPVCRRILYQLSHKGSPSVIKGLGMRTLGDCVWSLGWEYPVEKGKATHSSILAWRIPWTVWSMGLQRVGHDWVTFTLTY